MRQNCIFVAEICLQMSNMSYKKMKIISTKKAALKSQLKVCLGVLAHLFMFPRKLEEIILKLKHSLF